MEARSTLEEVQCNFKSGKSITRQIYIQLIGNEDRVPCKYMIFSNSARPKATFTLWLQLQGRLLIADILTKWGLEINTQCLMCQSSDETNEHFFLECEYSKRVWHILLQWAQERPMNTVGGQQHQQEIISRSKGKSPVAQHFKMMYAEYVYSIWIERNMRIFEKVYRASESLTRDIACVCSARAPVRIRRDVLMFRF
ncbi:uncharacterized protein [Nicotiana tomentosiformis]|uniref:uncharacterized protein n=1 Tax=Nicotiana tomentosiformis TaxID=4098 RepID=UPI00388C6458